MNGLVGEQQQKHKLEELIHCEGDEPEKKKLRTEEVNEELAPVKRSQGQIPQNDTGNRIKGETEIPLPIKLRILVEALKRTSPLLIQRTESLELEAVERTFFLYNIHQISERKKHILEYISNILGSNLKEKVKSGFCSDILSGKMENPNSGGMIYVYNFRNISIQRETLWKFYKIYFNKSLYCEGLKNFFTKKMRVVCSDICPELRRIKLQTNFSEEVCYLLRKFTTLETSSNTHNFCCSYAFVPNLDFDFTKSTSSSFIEVFWCTTSTSESKTTFYSIQQIVDTGDKFSKSKIFSYLKAECKTKNVLSKYLSYFRISEAVVDSFRKKR